MNLTKFRRLRRRHIGTTPHCRVQIGKAGSLFPALAFRFSSYIMSKLECFTICGWQRDYFGQFIPWTIGEKPEYVHILRVNFRK